MNTPGTAGQHPVPEDAQPIAMTVDGSGLLCVRLLLLLRVHIADLPGGSHVHVVATDPAAPLDLPAWCDLIGHRYLGVLPDRQPPVHILQLCDSPRATDPARPWHLACPS